jgi:opacity protein-like surface antigen
MRRVFVFLFLAGLVATAPASAQDKRFDVNIGGGYTVALSDIKNYLGNGYNFNLGATIWATPSIGIQAEYSFNGMGQKHIVDLPVTPGPGTGTAISQPFYGDMNMQYGDFNLVFRPAVQGKAHPYLVAGLGVYYRPMKITTPGVGYVPGYCNPWWYYCVPGGYVPVENVIASRSSTDMGIDFGGGVNVKLGESAAFYVEARYHYIWGPSITNPSTSTTTKANGQFFPITFGFRF